MNYGAVISIIGGTLAVVAYVVKLTMDYSRLKSKVEQLDHETKEAESEVATLEKDSRDKITAIHGTVNSIETRMAHIASRMEEDRAKNSEKFSDLYAHKDETRETLVKLTASVESMMRLFDSRFAAFEKQQAELSGQVKDLTRMLNEMKYTRVEKKKRTASEEGE